jgi:DNA-binding transcriptional LysR family regulator
MLNDVDLSRADLNLLVLFETVMAEQHVGRAATRLNLTASAVSHGLKRLRQMLGDPLFLRTPRGVVPTARAAELAPAIAEVLARVRNVIASAAPFDPARTRRRFSIAAPDGVSAVFLPPLLRELKRSAPGVDISLKQLLPREGVVTPVLAWRQAYEALDAREMDVAIMPIAEAPARFHAEVLFEEDFVLAMRKGHAYAKHPGMERYCKEQHLVVSHNGDPHGFIDTELAQKGLSRRVALTVPNFLFALATLADSDLIAALPGRFVAMHGKQLGTISVPPPLKLPSYRLTLVTPQVAMLDAGLAWFVALLGRLKL